MAATIHDVAQKAGVAHGTVSRYLNGYTLREKNRLLVEKAIEELDYQENILAKGLKGNRSMTIAVVVPGYTAIFSMFVTSFIEKVVERDNYSLILCDFEGSPDNFKKKLTFLKNRSIDGIILFPVQALQACISFLEDYAQTGIPIVVVNELLEGFETDAVLVDNFNAAFRAVEQLILDNHRHIACITGGEHSYTAQQRLAGYHDAMRAYDFEVREDWVQHVEITSAGGYGAVKAMFNNPIPPTAIFTANYFTMVGAAMALHELHLRIPDDVSLFGFDYFKPFDVVEPALTLVQQPLEKIGEEAANLMLRRIHGDDADFPQTVTLNTTMLIRDSVQRRS